MHAYHLSCMHKGQMHFDGAGCSRNVTRAMQFWGEAVGICGIRGWVYAVPMLQIGC